MKNPFKLITKQELFIVSGIALIVTLISVISIIIITSVKNKNIVSASIEEDNRTERQALLQGNGFGIEDFYRDSREPEPGVSYPVYRRKSTWIDDDIELYWIDPAEAGIDTLKTDNDTLILQSLESAK